MDHRAGPEEQQSLEEGMGHQMEDGDSPSPHSQSHEHVSQLGYGRVGQHLLDVLLTDADDGRENGREGPDAPHYQERRRPTREDDRTPRYQVDASRDHSRGVDESRHRSGALHGVRQPHVQRELRRFTHRPHEEL